MDNLGFTFHTINGEKYWTENAYYEFSEAQVEQVYEATKELSDMCLKAVQYVIDKNLFHKLKIHPDVAGVIKATWAAKAPTLYGRFDLGWDGIGAIKMYEYNADTPTSLMEASIAQHFWREDYFPEADQYNSIHEQLKLQFEVIRDSHMSMDSALYFTYVPESDEDTRTTQYLCDVAKEVNIDARMIAIADVGHNGAYFTDLDDRRIENMFKLYPWEWIDKEDFGKFAFRDISLWLEPVWKMVLSNKGILPILWEMYPNHPLLLEAYFDEKGQPKIVDKLGNACYVRKPIYSREGANITLFTGEGATEETKGEYGKEGYIIQALHYLPNFGLDDDRICPVIGSWIVGNEPCGMGIREDNSFITTNTSRFVPHIFR